MDVKKAIMRLKNKNKTISDICQTLGLQKINWLEYNKEERMS